MFVGLEMVASKQYTSSGYLDTNNQFTSNVLVVTRKPSAAGAVHSLQQAGLSAAKGLNKAMPVREGTFFILGSELSVSLLD